MNTPLARPAPARAAVPQPSGTVDAHAPARLLIGFGEVRHARLRPKANAFASRRNRPTSTSQKVRQ